MFMVYSFLVFILTWKISSTMSCQQIYVGLEDKSKNIDSCFFNNLANSLKILNDITNFTKIDIFFIDVQKFHEINEEITIQNRNTTIRY